MKARGLLVVLIVLSLSHSAIAQVPAVPAAPAAAATPVPTVWDKLGLTKQCCDDCKAACCASPLGQMLNNMTKPLSFASGGIIPPICPTVPSEADLNKLLAADSTASDAEKTAAEIKADEAGAAKRRAAIRYLGTVDCHYYPEAESAIISGLRGDRNECVRFEAALALSKGCCCTKKTLAALLITANSSSSDGNPSETSERVKTMAIYALQRCTAKVTDRRTEPTSPEPPPAGTPEPPGSAKKPGETTVQLGDFYTQELPRHTQSQLLDEASRFLAETISTSPTARRLPSSPNSLTGIVASLSGPTTVSTQADDDKAFDEAVLMLPEMRAPAPPPPPARVEPPRPLTLTAAPPLVQPQ